MNGLLLDFTMGFFFHLKLIHHLKVHEILEFSLCLNRGCGNTASASLGRSQSRPADEVSSSLNISWSLLRKPVVCLLWTDFEISARNYR